MRTWSLSAIAFGLFVIGCQSSTPSDSTQTASNTPSTPPASSNAATPPATSTAGDAAKGAFVPVQAVLTANCVKCHGAGKPRAGVALDSYAGVMKGGEDGPIVKAGDPDTSEIILVMKGAPGHKAMPPKGPKVSDDQIKTVSDWIKGGAKNG